MQSETRVLSVQRQLLSILHDLMTVLFKSRHFLWWWHGEGFARTRGQ